MPTVQTECRPKIVSGSCWRRKSDGRLAIVVDYWWFSRQWEVDTREPELAAYERCHTRDELLTNFDWVADPGKPAGDDL